VDVNLLEEDEYSSFLFELSDFPNNEVDFYAKWTAAHRWR
jgi:hypothetical protein